MLGLLVACATIAHGLSIFPDISDTRVAGTTNREIARGIASDGTNFLVVFQGDNLYPSANQTNQLAAQLVSSNGSLLGARIDLSLNGGVPLVEFGTSNYLMTWMDNAGGDGANIRGQFLDRTGNVCGASFLVASNTSAVEAGAMTFAAGTFWIAWAQTNVTNGAGVMLQRVSESGVQVGDAIAVGSQSSTNQQFPALSRGDTNVLVTWVALRFDTNAWDVIGRFVDTNGNPSGETVVSQSPALQAYPVAAAYDGTNHLVVWSREAGLSRNMILSFELTYYAILATNQYPAIFGRLVSASGLNAAEISISSARFGQVSPSVAFDGTNYLVAWHDRRYADYQLITYCCQGGKGWLIPPATNQMLFFSFVSRAGTLVDWEFIGIPTPTNTTYFLNVPPEDFDKGARIDSGPVIKIASRSAGVVRNRRSENGLTNDVSLTCLLPPHPGFGEVKFLGIGTNSDPYTLHPPPYVRLQILSTNSHFIPQWSSNGVNWITPPNSDSYDYDHDFSDTDVIESVWWWGIGGDFDSYKLRFDSVVRFFRGLESKYLCKSGLRHVARLKEAWALERNLGGSAVPMDTDLFTYRWEKHACPRGGWGTTSLLPINGLPNCSVPSHQFP